MVNIYSWAPKEHGINSEGTLRTLTILFAKENKFVLHVLIVSRTHNLSEWEWSGSSKDRSSKEMASTSNSNWSSLVPGTRLLYSRLPPQTNRTDGCSDSINHQRSRQTVHRMRTDTTSGVRCSKEDSILIPVSDHNRSWGSRQKGYLCDMQCQQTRSRSCADIWVNLGDGQTSGLWFNAIFSTSEELSSSQERIISDHKSTDMMDIRLTGLEVQSLHQLSHTWALHDPKQPV